MFYRIGLACITPYRLLLVCKALTTQIFLIRVRDKNILRTFQSGKNGRKVIFKIFTDFLLTMSGGKYRKYWPGVKMEGEIDKKNSHLKIGKTAKEECVFDPVKKIAKKSCENGGEQITVKVLCYTAKKHTSEIKNRFINLSVSQN